MRGFVSRRVARGEPARASPRLLILSRHCTLSRSISRNALRIFARFLGCRGRRATLRDTTDSELGSRLGRVGTAKGWLAVMFATPRDGPDDALFRCQRLGRPFLRRGRRLCRRPMEICAWFERASDFSEWGMWSCAWVAPCRATPRAVSRCLLWRRHYRNAT